MPLTTAMTAFIMSRDPSVSAEREPKAVVSTASSPTLPSIFVTPYSVTPRPAPPARPPTTPSDGPSAKVGGSDEEKSDGIPASLIEPLRSMLIVKPQSVSREYKLEGPKYEPNGVVIPKDTVRNQWGLKDRFGVMWRGPDKDTLERWVATRNATPDATAPAYYYPLSPPRCPGGRCPSR